MGVAGAYNPGLTVGLMTVFYQKTILLCVINKKKRDRAAALSRLFIVCCVAYFV